jgi:hypothetical protein
MIDRSVGTDCVAAETITKTKFAAGASSGILILIAMRFGLSGITGQ